MKAIAAHPASREVRIIDHPEPGDPGPDEVKLRILEVGICGTDKEIARFDYGEPPEGADHLVIGHEALGEVLSVGSKVQSIAPDDIVVPMVRRPCPHPECLACREGRQDFCYTGDFTERGIRGAHGFMTEAVIEDSRYLVPVPRALRDVAVLVEPLTIAEKAMIQVWDVQERLPWECREARSSGRAPRLRALVLGAGPVGLLGAMKLALEGFDVFVYSREPAGGEKASLVQAFGGEYLSAKDHDPSALGERLGRVDLVYEAVGASQLAFEVLDVLGPNAVFVFTGVPGRKEPVNVNAGRIMFNLVTKNQLLFGTVNAGRDAFEAAVADLGRFRERFPSAIGGLITGRHPMGRYAELLEGKRGGIKNVVAVSGA